MNWVQGKGMELIRLGLTASMVAMIGCAKMKSNMATYEANKKLHQPEKRVIKRHRDPENYEVVAVKNPPEQLQVVYRTKEELVQRLEARPSYQKMADPEKGVELKMLPAGGLVKVMENHYVPGNEYTVELYAKTSRIGKCSNDLSDHGWKDYDPDMEYAATYSGQATPIGVERSMESIPSMRVDCPVPIPNPDTLFVHVSKNSAKYAVYRIIVAP